MRVRAFALAWCVAATLAQADVVRVEAPEGRTIRLTCRETMVTIARDGFRFAFEHDGRRIAAHPTAGLLIDGQPVTKVELRDTQENLALFDVWAGESRATAEVRFADDAVTFDLTAPHAMTFALQLAGGLAPAYGLGDHGGQGESANLANVDLVEMRNDGGSKKCRFISTFAIFPRQRFAGVTFHADRPSVAIGGDAYRLATPKTTKTRTAYFFGDPKEIYAAYRTARTEAGYPEMTPHARLFEVGWESWDALRWKADQRTVHETLQHYVDRGYPIRWAVTGSGFWENGGTTTSFGRWHPDRWPDPAGFKAWLASHDIKWMIGLRTNFVIAPAKAHGPYTDYTVGPHSAELRERGLFVADADGKPTVVKSTAFPRADCLMLDGARPGAAKWFADFYAKWNVDGVKEDTMMRLDRIDLFNAPMRELHERGQLVMARCAAFSVPGTLLRTEDQKDIDMITARIPLTFLAQAASAAPNVYVDTVGWGVMDTDVRGAMRQAWFNALTAGFAVGALPGDIWSDADKAALDKAVWFHHALVPYLYSATVDASRDGYPHTLTPLPIAFPDDPAVDELASKETQQYAFMVGPSLLATPYLKSDFRTSDALDIYLPAGKWIDYETGEAFTGPTTLKARAMPIDRVPAFVGGPAILVLRDRDESLRASIFPNSPRGATFTLTHLDGQSKTTIVNAADVIDDRTAVTCDGEKIDADRDAKTGAMQFMIQPGKRYELTHPR